VARAEGARRQMAAKRRKKARSAVWMENEAIAIDFSSKGR